MCWVPLFFCLDRCGNVALDSQLAPSILVPQSYKAGPQLEDLRYPGGAAEGCMGMAVLHLQLPRGLPLKSLASSSPEWGSCSASLRP